MEQQQEEKPLAKVINKKTVITISPKVHFELNNFCQQNGLKIGFFAEQALEVALKKAISSKHLTD